MSQSSRIRNVFEQKKEQAVQVPHLIWHFPPEGGAAEYAGDGYAGRNEALNNPLYQLEPNVGPLPEGTYTIGPI